MESTLKEKFQQGLKGLELALKRLVFGLCSACFTTGPTACPKAGPKTGPKPPKDNKPANPGDFRRILFLRYDKLGDMIVSLQVFETLTKVAPDLEIEVLASPGSSGIIAHDSRVKQIWLYSKKPWRDLLVLRALRKRNYDAVVDLICLDSVTSLFISQYLGRKVMRIGIGKSRFKKYYTHHVPLNDSNYQHIVESTLNVLTFLGITEEQFIHQAPLHLPKNADSDASKLIADLKARHKVRHKVHHKANTATTNSDVSPEPTIVGVNISAGKPNRIWHNNNYSELISKIVGASADSDKPGTIDKIADRQTNSIVVVICTTADRARAQQIIDAVNAPVFLIPTGLNILQVAGVIANLNLLISPDTSVIHIARQHDVPVVGMYPTDGRSAAQWRPYRQPDGQVQSTGDCHIHDITPEQVFQEYQKVCARTQKVTA